MLKRLLVGALALAIMTAAAMAATLLPPGSIQFFDNNGAPLSGGQVFFYIPNTTTPKSTYQNSAATILNANPVILDSSGRAIIYGTGAYQELVEDANGNLIWNQVTADTSGGSYSWAGTSTGSANAQTLNAPNFSATDGQTIGFIAGFSNTGAFTLNYGVGPVSVVKGTPTGPTSLTGGEIVAGVQYQVSYSVLDGNFQLVSYPFPTTIPVGSITGLGSGVATALGKAANASGGFPTLPLTYQSPQATAYGSGSGAYTTPSGALYLVVEMVGGGSGGQGSGSTTTGLGGNSSAAGATTFGTLTANGGAASNSGTSATAANCTLSLDGAIGAGAFNIAGSGGLGAASFYGGGGGTQIGEIAGLAATVPGAGGGGGSVTGSNAANGAGGNSGAYCYALITAPSGSYSYAVGAGSAGGAAGGSGFVGGAGATGLIKVVAYFQ